jgi:hypothetical protein
MAEREYDVARIHEGDKLYREGDVRIISESDAKHLVDLGVLIPRKSKSEPAPLNKMEGGAPANKAEYASMTVNDLKALAAKRGLDLGDATKKADIVAAFELADEELKAE